MLRIDRRQRAAFQCEQARQFEVRMCEHLKRNFAASNEHLVSVTALMRFVHDGIDAAARYGIALEYDVRRFIEHAATRGLAFAELPEFAEVLRNPRIDGTRKMDLVDEIDIFTRKP